MSKFFLMAATAVLAASAFSNSKGDHILQQIDGLTPPSFDAAKQQDTAYRKQFQAKYDDYLKTRDNLIFDLYKADPDNPRAADLMKERWLQFRADGVDFRSATKAAKADLDKVLTENPPQAIRESAEFSEIMLDERTQPAIGEGPNGGDAHKDYEKKMQDRIEGYVEKYPSSQYSPDLLFMESFSEQEDAKTKTYRELLAKYPKYKNIGLVKGALAQIDLVGKPFSLAFNDAIGGKRVGLADMKGKVVLVDFWATWCGPCVAEMPDVKKTYATYHDKGLEIVGVSLDLSQKDHGLDKLKAFVKDNSIPWPMYYQGNGWDSAFSSSMGIMSIPAMFLIDKNGNFQGVVDVRQPGFKEKLEKYLAASE